jgi:hypothetical protein
VRGDGTKVILTRTGGGSNHGSWRFVHRIAGHVKHAAKEVTPKDPPFA